MATMHHPSGRWPPNDTMPAPWHPAIAPVTGLSGSCNVGARTTAVSAGSMARMQPQTTHGNWTKGETL
jgi:hypothetical protein